MLGEGVRTQITGFCFVTQSDCSSGWGAVGGCLHVVLEIEEMFFKCTKMGVYRITQWTHKFSFPRSASCQCLATFASSVIFFTC